VVTRDKIADGREIGLEIKDINGTV